MLDRDRAVRNAELYRIGCALSEYGIGRGRMGLCAAQLSPPLATLDGNGRLSVVPILCMPESSSVDLRLHLDAVFRKEGGRILATLIRLLGDFDRAEDAMHDAFAIALHRWPAEGIPANPRGRPPGSCLATNQN